MQSVFHGKRALVMGGSSSVGFAIAAKLLEWGLTELVIAGRNPASGDAAVRDLTAKHPQAKISFTQADTTVQRDCDRLFGGLEGLDVFVHASGHGLDIEIFTDIHPDRYQPIADGHFMGFVRCCHGAIRAMNGRSGAIVAVGSDAGKVTTVGETLVGAMKAATFMFVRTLAMEVKRDGLRVNSVSPSIMEGTASYAGVKADPKIWRIFNRAEKRAQLGVPSAEDVANMAVFLCSPMADKITGQVVSVNGGISAA